MHARFAARRKFGPGLRPHSANFHADHRAWWGLALYGRDPKPARFNAARHRPARLRAQQRAKRRI